MKQTPAAAALPATAPAATDQSLEPRALRYRRIDKDQILDAAMALAAKEGAGKVTLDAVAQRAGVSKGGLLYRFPSKDALLAAMVDRLNAEFDEAIADARAGGAASELEAYVEAALTDGEEHDAVLASLLTAASESPRLVARFKGPQRARLEAILAAGASLEAAALAMLAADGLWLSELVGISPFTEEELVRVKAALARAAKAAAGEA